jgi:hypothetical protein
MNDFDARSTLDRLLAERRQTARAASPELLAAPTLDHREAKARTLAVLAGGDPLIAAKPALDALTARNCELLDHGPDAIRAALADQVAILEAVVSGFAFNAATARRIDDKRALAGVAIRASATLTATLAALHRVTEDQRNGAAITA